MKCAGVSLLLIAGGCSSGASAPSPETQLAADKEREQATQQVKTDPAIPQQAKDRILAAKPPTAVPAR